MFYESRNPSGRPQEVVAPFDVCLAREEFGDHDVPPSWGTHYRRSAIAVVLGGNFAYSSEDMLVDAVPGTVLFANAGTNLIVRHAGAPRNRRFVVWFDDQLLEEAARECGLDRARFPVIAAPPGKTSARIFSWMQRLHRDGKHAALELAASAMTTPGESCEPAPVGMYERDMILAVVRHVEKFYTEPCTVEELARLCGLSRFTFMRRFRAVIGQSVNQFVIATRLRAAALRLSHSKQPVSEIALDVGFNDLSHFNTSFRAAFGCTPRQMRR